MSEIGTVQFCESHNKFIQDGTMFRALGGPMNTGKSYFLTHLIVLMGGWIEPFNGVREVHVTISRSEYGKILTTTIPEFETHFPLGAFKKRIRRTPPHEGIMEFMGADGIPIRVNLLFMSLETQDDINSLRSLQTTYAWVNEAQEVMDPMILEMLSDRCCRFPFAVGSPLYPVKTVMLDFNYPDEDHWIYEYFIGKGNDNYAMHRMPPALLWVPAEDGPKEFKGERGDWHSNPDADYIQFIKQGEKYWRDIVERGAEDHYITKHVIGDFAPSEHGTPVYPRFNRAAHVQEKGLEPDPERGLVAAFDLELHPACVLGQLTDTGALHVFEEIYLGETHFQDLFENAFLPMMTEKYRDWQDKLSIVVDPSVRRDGNTGITAYSVMGEHGYMAQPAWTNKFNTRKDTVNYFLRQTEGFKISPACKLLVSGFGGKYSYRRKRGSETMHATPTKNDSSHVHDALQYLALFCKGGGRPDASTIKRRKSTHKYV